MFDRNFEDIVDEEQQHISEYKLPLNTIATFKNTNCLMSPNINSFESFPEANDLSIDRHLNQNNAELIQRSIVCYLRACLEDVFAENAPFKNGQLFRFPSYLEMEDDEDSELDALVYNNLLLNEQAKKFLLKNFKEFEELNGLFSSIKNMVGTCLTQQLVFILSTILEAKITQFREVLKPQNEDWLIPKMDRFWGEENCEVGLEGSWSCYEDLDYEEIKKFASADVEKLAAKLYFSKELNFLNLKRVEGDLKAGINIMDKFATLTIHLSRSVFLTLSGMAQRQSELSDFTSELSIHLSQEGKVVEYNRSKKVKLDYE